MKHFNLRFSLSFPWYYYIILMFFFYLKLPAYEFPVIRIANKNSARQLSWQLPNTQIMCTKRTPLFIQCLCRSTSIHRVRHNWVYRLHWGSGWMKFLCMNFLKNRRKLNFRAPYFILFFRRFTRRTGNWMMATTSFPHFCSGSGMRAAIKRDMIFKNGVKIGSAVSGAGAAAIV